MAYKFLCTYCARGFFREFAFFSYCSPGKEEYEYNILTTFSLHICVCVYVFLLHIRIISYVYIQLIFVRDTLENLARLHYDIHFMSYRERQHLIPSHELRSKNRYMVLRSSRNAQKFQANLIYIYISKRSYSNSNPSLTP